MISEVIIKIRCAQVTPYYFEPVSSIQVCFFDLDLGFYDGFVVMVLW
jgi:hypothetical protein